MKTRLREIIDELREMHECAEKEKRTFTSIEQSQWDKLSKEFDEIKLSNKEQPIHRQVTYGNFEKRNKSIGVRTMPEHKIEDDYKFDENGTSNRDAFNRYLRYGNNALTPTEFRALQADSDVSGGYLVMPEYLANIFIQELDNETFIRKKATKFSVPNAQSLGCPSLETDFGDISFTSELGTGSEDSDLDFSKRNLYPHAMARRIKVSNKLLRAASLNPEQIVRQRMIYKISVVQENAFLNGNGINQPLGIFTSSDSGIDADRDISTGNSTTNVTTDGLINAVGHMKSPYRKRAVWIMHRDLETRLAKLKDGNGQHIWKGAIDARYPNTLLGFPIYLSEYAPNTFTSGKYVACLANLSFYYIADALDMQVQRLIEIAARTNQTEFICRAEVDGMPVVSAAYVRVKLA